MTDVPSGGLSWSSDLDLEALLAAVTGPAPWTSGAPGETGSEATETEDQDAALAEYLDAVDAGRSRVIPLPVIAGRIAESLPTPMGRSYTTQPDSHAA